MKIIGLRISNGELAPAMSAMREWLDQNHFEVHSFDFAEAGEEMVLQVGFALTAQADAFAARFCRLTLDRMAG